HRDDGRRDEYADIKVAILGAVIVDRHFADLFPCGRSTGRSPTSTALRSPPRLTPFSTFALNTQAASIASTLVRANSSSLRVSASNFRMPSLSLSLAMASALCS